MYINTLIYKFNNNILLMTTIVTAFFDIGRDKKGDGLTID